MDLDPAEALEQPVTKQLAVRVTPELRQAIRMRCAILDMTLTEFVAASLEVVLKAEIDPRPWG